MEKNPGIQYEALRGLIRPYAKEYAITPSLLQDARDAAKKVIFGIAEDNVCYAEGVVAAMRELGHTAELVYTSRDETLAAIKTIVIYEEINRRKIKNEPPFDGIADRMVFWKKWKEDNALWIINTLGIKGGLLKIDSSVASLLPHLPARVSSTPHRKWYKRMEHIHRLVNTPYFRLIQPQPMPTCPASHSGFCLGTKTSRT